MSIKMTKTFDNNSVIHICKDIIRELITDIVKDESEVSKLSTTTFMTGVWIAEPSLGRGWKTCLINPLIPVGGHDKRMFYSPCGKLFTSRDEAETFSRRPPSPAVKKSRSLSRRNSADVIPVTLPIKPVEVSVVRLRTLNCNYKVESEEISLSDEEFIEEPPPVKKRKISKTKTKKRRVKTEMMLTEEQERLLEECYQEWPSPGDQIVEVISQDLESVCPEKRSVSTERVRSWFKHKNNSEFRRIFNSVF